MLRVSFAAFPIQMCEPVVRALGCVGIESHQEVKEDVFAYFVQRRGPSINKHIELTTPQDCFPAALSNGVREVAFREHLMVRKHDDVNRAVT